MDMEEGKTITKRRKLMIMEVLSQGQMLAKQLQSYLDDPSSHSDMRDYLIGEILSTYDKAISVASLPSSDQVGERRPSRKRKSLPRWVKEVKVESEKEQESLNDGFNWRKYGQKDIHGAAFPRAYLRCSQLHSEGCIATKQIQKSDEDPTIFYVTYRGHHTCTQSNQDTHRAIRVRESAAKEDVEEEGPAEAEAEQAEERFVFRCFSFSNAPLIEPDVADAWFISEASPASNVLGNEDGGYGGMNSEFTGQRDCPEFSVDDLGIFDTDFSFDVEILS